MALSKKWKDKWVKALRSGKYKKGKGALRARDNTFCCLGVLCDIKGRKWRQQDKNDNYYVLTKYGTKDATGMRDGNSSLDGIGGTNINKLIQLNDSGHFGSERAYSFKQIANWIEKNL